MRGGTILSLSASALALLHSPLAAQSLPDTAPSIPRDDPEFETTPARIGPFDVSASVEATGYYDSNLYARQDDEIDDIVFEVSPSFRAVHEAGPVQLGFGAQSRLRRHVDQTAEDSEAARFFGDFSWSPMEQERLSVGIAFERAIEDRGDPEARDVLAPGPRELDIWTGEAQYRRARGKVLVDLRARAAKFDALSPIDDDRDFTSYSGSATLGMRIAGSVFMTATGFANRREFRLGLDPLGLERDSTTIGGRLGVDIAPGGLFEGSLSAGIFRFQPDEPTFDDRTGLSLAANLVYRPQQRTALIFTGSNGDVATFRNGATGRTDTRLSMTWQQEIRHNLYSSLSAGYRSSRFRGTGIEEDTIVAKGEVEYLLNRHMSFVVDASYGDRTSDILSDEFDRFRAGVGVRLSF